MEELKKAQKNLAELIHNQKIMGFTVSGLEEVQTQLNNHKKQLATPVTNKCYIIAEHKVNTWIPIENGREFKDYETAHEWMQSRFTRDTMVKVVRKNVC